MATATVRKQFLAACAASEPTKLLDFRKSKAGKSFDFGEFAQVLAKKDHEGLWNGINITLADSIDRHVADGLLTKAASPTDVSQEATATLEYMKLVAELAGAFVEQTSSGTKSFVSVSMLAAVQLLHDNMFNVPEYAEDVRVAVTKLGESWWHQNLLHKELLVPNTLLSLLMLALQPDAKAAVIKRVYAFREGLLLLNLEEARSKTLRDVLCQCLISQNFISCVEGERFLSYLFGLAIPLTEMLHETMKSTLPYCPLDTLDVFGKVYFRAWRAATGPFLAHMEHDCIQDLVHLAIHTRRVGALGNFIDMPLRIRQLLDAFHDQKKERGVDEMLLRLYEPVVFRSLSVANPHVRANATALLVSAFPLADADAPRAEADQTMERQLEALLTALDDPSPLVRATAAEGVARVCSVYWELLDGSWLSKAISHIVTKLARDGSSSSARAAAIKGLTFLLDNHLAQPLLKKLLPKMGQVVHDSSAKIRGLFLDMLLVVKGLSNIQFWDICPVSDLLARLETETVGNAEKLTQLLMESYFPLDKSKTDEERVRRCMQLSKDNSDAARRFYALLPRVANRADVARFIVVLGNVVEQTINGTSDEDDILQDDFGSSSTDALSSDQMRMALECITVLVDAMAAVKKNQEGSTLKKLATALDGLVRALFEAQEAGHVDDVVSATLAVLTARLPISSNKKQRAAKAIASLKSLSNSTAEESPQQIMSLVDCLCGLKQGKAAAKLAVEMLSAALPSVCTAGTGLDQGEEPSNKRKKGKKKSSSEPSAGVESTLKPALGNAIISRLLFNMAHGMASNDDLALISEQLGCVFEDITETKLSYSSPMDSAVDKLLTDDAVVTLAALWGKLALLQARKSPAQATAVMTQMIQWSYNELLPRVACLSADGQSANTSSQLPRALRTPRTKGASLFKKKDQKSVLASCTLAARLLTTCLKVFTFGAALGQLADSTVEGVAGVCEAALSTARGFTFLSTVTPFACQVASSTSAIASEDDVDDVLFRLLSKCFECTDTALKDLHTPDMDGKKGTANQQAAASALRGMLSSYAQVFQQRRMLGTFLSKLHDLVFESMLKTHRHHREAIDATLPRSAELTCQLACKANPTLRKFLACSVEQENLTADAAFTSTQLMAFMLEHTDVVEKKRLVRQHLELLQQRIGQLARKDGPAGQDGEEATAEPAADDESDDGITPIEANTPKQLKKKTGGLSEEERESLRDVFGEITQLLSSQ